MIWAIVGSQAELERIVGKRLHGHQIEHMELEPSFSEFREAGIDPSWWMRGCAS